MIKFKRLRCKLFGHKWIYYAAESFKGTSYNYDSEQVGYLPFEKAGYCKRCGFDTHGQYYKKYRDK